MDGSLSQDSPKGSSPAPSLKESPKRAAESTNDGLMKRLASMKDLFAPAAQPAQDDDSNQPEAKEEVPHVTRLGRYSIELLDEVTEALQRDSIVNPPPKKQGTPPLKALLKGSWVLALMAAIITIIIISKDRLHVPEPLDGVHATDGIYPYVVAVDDSSVDYLYVTLVIGPYFPSANSSSGGSGGSHRRRLAQWVGEAVSLRDSGQPLALNADVARGARKLLASPELTLGSRRDLLTAAGVDEPSNEGLTGLPELKVTLVQQNINATDFYLGPSAPTPGASASCALTTAQLQAYVPVSESQFCTLKEATAVKCSLTFRGDDLNSSVLVEGQALYLAFESTNLMQIVFQAEMSELGGLGPAKNWLALTILLLVLVGIASERIHRMWCAMIGAAFMMSLLLWMDMAPSLARVVDWIDESTLGLLFGMMIIVGRLKDTGFFELVSAAAVKASKGRMWALSLMLMCLTAFLSAWLDNVTTMLLMAPVSISVMRQCNMNPIPILMGQVLMSNIGGAATMVGDPPALIIGAALSSYIGFIDFIINMAPGVLLAALFCIPLILFIYRKNLMGSISAFDSVLEAMKSFQITDWDLFAKCAYVTGAVIIGFLLHPVHHVDPAWFALIGAVVLCICTEPMEVERVLHNVEWDMLLFFASMFVMVEAAAEIGMISMVAGWLESWIRAVPEDSRTIVAIQILLWVSAVLSGILDNIPYTVTMVPVIEYLASSGLGLDIAVLAWALNFGACFGGNATLIGASANIVTATLAERAGEKITFIGWLKSGIPVTIASVVAADIWMLLRFCL